MPGSSRQHRGEKRRKELARQARQQEKRQRRAERKEAGGTGPPIDWEAAGGSPGEPDGASLDAPEAEAPDEGGGTAEPSPDDRRP
jgi:hypothetical protein